MFFLTRLTFGSTFEIDGTVWTVQSFGATDVDQMRSAGLLRDIEATMINEAGETMTMRIFGLALNGEQLQGLVAMASADTAEVQA